MDASDLDERPPARVPTCRDGRPVIAEDVRTEPAARTRFAAAIDLCKTRDDAHAHRVELPCGGATIAAWPQPARSRRGVAFEDLPCTT